MKDDRSLDVGDDSVVMGDVSGDVGDRSVVVGATDNQGNVILNQPMAVGRNAVAGPGSIAIGSGARAGIDSSALAIELSHLRQAMREQATSPEHNIAADEVEAAEEAAAKGDGAAVSEHLKKAGKWALDFATKIGAGVAVHAIKTSLGL